MRLQLALAACLLTAPASAATEIDLFFPVPVQGKLATEMQRLVSVFNKRIVRAALASPGVTPEWIDGYADPARYEFFMPREPTD